MTVLKPLRHITVVGGGQAGLILAIGLRQSGHHVRLVQERSGLEIANGRVLSGQCVFAPGRAAEQALGLDLWSTICPRIEAIHFASTGMNAGDEASSFIGRLHAPAESIDQRLKFPVLMKIFEALGGGLELIAADKACLERAARESDLVVVTAGKSTLSSLFAVDRARSPFSAPMRMLSMIYLRGIAGDHVRDYISSITVANAGTVMRFPTLTHGGSCEVLLFEAMPGGPLDVGRKGMMPDELLAAMGDALSKCLPQMHEQIAGAHVTDAGGGLCGSVIPTVRQGVGYLPSGRAVLGLGDVVVLNDPLVGQGANNAIRMAMACLQAINSHSGRLDEAWMASCANAAWKEARAATVWTNMSLRPPSALAHALMLRAEDDQALADRMAQGFEDPATILPLLLGFEKT